MHQQSAVSAALFVSSVWAGVSAGMQSGENREGEVLGSPKHNVIVRWEASPRSQGELTRINPNPKVTALDETKPKKASKKS